MSFNYNPQEVVDKGWVLLAKESKVGPAGIDFTIDRDLTLKPGDPSINILFQEYVKIPEDACMLFRLRSSHSRRGLYCATALFEPFYGCSEEMKETGATTGMSIVNLGTEPFEFKKGDRIAQAIFLKCDSAYKYDGHYNQNVENVKSQYAK